MIFLCNVTNACTHQGCAVSLQRSTSAFVTCGVVLGDVLCVRGAIASSTSSSTCFVMLSFLSPRTDKYHACLACKIMVALFHDVSTLALRAHGWVQDPWDYGQRTFGMTVVSSSHTQFRNLK